MNEIEQIKEVLIEMQHKTLAGLYLGCPLCGEGVGRKVEDVVVYWDKLMDIVQSSNRTVIENES